jgi:hypothetical protein
MLYTINSPSLNVPIGIYASKILQVLAANVPLVLASTGIIAGILVMLRVAAKYLGMRVYEYKALYYGPVDGFSNKYGAGYTDHEGRIHVTHGPKDEFGVRAPYEVSGNGTYKGEFKIK